MKPIKSSDFSKDLSAVPRPYSELNYTQRMYIDWKALSGLVYDQNREGEQALPRKMPIYELAALCGVTVDAFYQAKATIPNFWELVSERRQQLGGQTRLEKMQAVWYLNALKMKNWPLTEAWLINNDPTYKTPKLKVQHDIGDGLADALNIARERRQKSRAMVEGEVVDGSPNT